MYPQSFNLPGAPGARIAALVPPPEAALRLAAKFQAATAPSRVAATGPVTPSVSVDAR